MTVTVFSAGVGGVIAAPPSKSAAHRAILCAALAGGASRLTNVQTSQDIEATLGAVQQLGAKVVGDGAALTVTGRGSGGFATVTRPVFCRESGSTLRFLIPLFSLTAQKITFTGAERLFARPQTVYQTIFENQGLRFEAGPAQLRIQGRLRADHFTLPGDVSSQFVTGLLLTAPLLEEPSTITVRPPFESRSYVEMTLDTLHRFGIAVGQKKLPKGGMQYTVAPQRYQPQDLTVEGDYSQAAFPLVLGALCPGPGVTVTGLDPNSRQGDKVILELLRRFGAEIQVDAGAVTVRSAPLHGIDIDLADCPDLGPILMTAACFARGDTVIRNAGRLRLKESDRIAAMQQELGLLGARVQADGDTVTVTGTPLHAPPQGAVLQGHNDHRVVMSLTVAALAAGQPCSIAGAQAVAKSWPNFFVDMAVLGLKGERSNG